MTISEALENALTMLEAQGIKGGDVYDDLVLALSRLRSRFPAAAEFEL